MGLPKEIEEAATIDGISELGLFLKIVLPLSTPVVASIGLFTMVGHWNNWFDGAMYMNSSNYPLQTYIYEMIQGAQSIKQNQNLTPEQLEQLGNLPGQTLRSAQIFIAMLPIMLVYPFVQKYFIKGLTQGGVKE